MNIRFLMMAIFATTAFAFTGCGEKDPVGGEEPPQIEQDYVMTISGVASSSAKAEITPDDKTKPYLVDYMTATDYADLGGKPEYIGDYVSEYLAELAKRQGESIANIVDKLSHRGDRIGDKAVTLSDLEPETDYIAYVIGINTNGEATDKGVIAAFKTSAMMGNNPEIEIVMTPGDVDGNNPAAIMSVIARSEGIVSGVKAFYPTAVIAGSLAQGVSYDVLLDLYGEALSQKNIEDINSPEGFLYTYPYCNPDTEYTYMIRVYNDSGSVTGHQDQKTSAVNPSSVQTASTQVLVVSAENK